MSVSVIWRPMVSTGLSELIGSWKIIEISLPRMSRIPRSDRASRSWPPKRMLPSTMRPGGEAIRRNMESEVTVLPQPDSPTTASVSPGATEKEMPSTARTTPSRVKEWVFRPSISSRGAALGMLAGSVGSHVAGKGRVKRVAQAVGDEIDRQDRQREEKAWEEDQ